LFLEKKVFFDTDKFFVSLSNKRGFLMILTNKTELETVKSILNRLFAKSSDGFFLMTLEQPIVWNSSLSIEEKEKKLKILFKNISIQSVNNALLKQFKIPIRNFDTINRFQKLLFEKSFEKIKTFWIELFDEGTKKSTLFMKTVQGAPLVVEGEYTVLTDEKKNVFAVFGLQHDITERVNLEENMSDREIYLKEVWDKANVGILVLQNEDIVYYNSYLTDLFVPRVKPRGNTYKISDLLYPEDWVLVKQKMEQRKRGDNSVFTYDIKALKTDGTTGFVKVYTTFFYWKGKPAILIFATDITEQRRIEKELVENEQKYRLLAENSIDGIALYEEKKLVYASPAYLEMFPEMKRLKTYDKYIETYVYEDDVKNVKQFFEKLGGKKFSEGSMRYRVVKEKDVIRWMEDRLKLVEENGVQKLQVLAIDVTDRVENEFSLKEREMQLDSLMNTINDIIFHIDNDGVILYVSKQVASLGYHYRELISKNIIEFIDIDNVSSVLELFSLDEKALSEKPFFTIQFQTKDNRVAWLEISANKSYDDTIVLVARNITERRLAEWKIEQYQEEMEQMLALKDKSFSVIAHDLRMPFNQILGFSELLKKNLYTYNKGKIEHFVNIIYKASMQSYNLLENLLQWSLWQQNQLMFSPEKVDVKRMIEMELEKLEVEISVKSLFLKTELEEIEGLFDVNMLRSIIRNLINNAVHFTPNRGNVTIILKRKNKTIVFEVRDTGIGISAEKIKELLAENADTSNQQGFGILLTKTFAKYHNATLQIESEQGKGTTVRVTFNNRI